jgi:hypothetical protein
MLFVIKNLTVNQNNKNTFFQDFLFIFKFEKKMTRFISSTVFLFKKIIIKQFYFNFIIFQYLHNFIWLFINLSY